MLRLLAPLALVLSLAAAERPLLHPLFSDHAVLQRGRPIPVWGWAPAGTTVTVNLDGERATAMADDQDRWRVDLPARPAGGPHVLTVIAGAATATASDLLIGEVWICSGQSNMEQGVNISRDPQAEIAAADHPRLRLCWVRKSTALEPQPLADLSWAVCSPGTLGKHGSWGGFSAVAYFFGRALQADLDVPVGLIHASWGGTPAQAWISREGIAPLGDFAEILADIDTAVADGGEDRYEQRLAAWWADKDPGSREGWKEPGHDDSAWATMKVPGPWERQGHAGLDGAVWFRRGIDIPADWAGRDLMLSLGTIDDADTTYLDGATVGSDRRWNAPRRYRIPGAQVQAGARHLAVRVLDTGGGGGFHGDDAAFWIAPADAEDQKIALAGDWRYQVAIDDLRKVGRPPQPLGQNPHTPTSLSNAMIEPLVPYACAGAIWYQGESNAGNPAQYRKLLPALIADWRRRFANDDLGFGVVQLASFMDRVEAPIQEGWAALREAQAWTVANDPKTWLAVAIDIGEAKDIHPKNKQDVGLRLAKGALAVHYGKEIVGSGPVFDHLTIDGASVTVHFRHSTGLATTDGAPPLAFALAGPDGTWHQAEARIDGETVVLTSGAVGEPRAVRYAWANNPAVNLVNGAGLPGVPFRSDAP